MKPNESRLNSGITPRTILPFGPGGTSPETRAFFLGKFSVLSMFLDDAGASLLWTSEQISIDPWITLGNDDGCHRIRIELHRSDPSYDAVNVTHFLQTLQAGKQQSFANAFTSRSINDTHRPKKSLTSAFIGGEPNEVLLEGGNNYSHGLVCKSN